MLGPRQSCASAPLGWEGDRRGGRGHSRSGLALCEGEKGIVQAWGKEQAFPGTGWKARRFQREREALRANPPPPLPSPHHSIYSPAPGRRQGFCGN